MDTHPLLGTPRFWGIAPHILLVISHLGGCPSKYGGSGGARIFPLLSWFLKFCSFCLHCITRRLVSSLQQNSLPCIQPFITLCPYGKTALKDFGEKRCSATTEHRRPYPFPCHMATRKRDTGPCVRRPCQTRCRVPSAHCHCASTLGTHRTSGTVATFSSWYFLSTDFSFSRAKPLLHIVGSVL